MDRHTCGHEFIGEVVALGESFNANTQGRPALYSSLKINDKVVSPFTVNCGECQWVLVTPNLSNFLIGQCLSSGVYGPLP